MMGRRAASEDLPLTKIWCLPRSETCHRVAKKERRACAAHGPLARQGATRQGTGCPLSSHSPSMPKAPSAISLVRRPFMSKLRPLRTDFAPELSHGLPLQTSPFLPAVRRREVAQIS